MTLSGVLTTLHYVGSSAVTGSITISGTVNALVGGGSVQLQFASKTAGVISTIIANQTYVTAHKIR
jgi:hypothetical protein